MEPAIWGFIGTIVGAVVGSLASLVATVITGRNARLLQLQTDSMQRNQSAREFQRDNLLSLQEHLTAHLRLIARAHLEDVESYQKSDSSGIQSMHLLSDELNEDLRNSSAKISMLIERVSDNSLREQIKAVRKKVEQVLDARSAQESNQRMIDSMPLYENTMERIGTNLRSFY